MNMARFIIKIRSTVKNPILHVFSREVDADNKGMANDMILNNKKLPGGYRITETKEIINSELKIKN